MVCLYFLYACEKVQLWHVGLVILWSPKTILADPDTFLSAQSAASRLEGGWKVPRWICPGGGRTNIRFGEVWSYSNQSLAITLIHQPHKLNSALSCWVRGGGWMNCTSTWRWAKNLWCFTLGVAFFSLTEFFGGWTSDPKIFVHRTWILDIYLYWYTLLLVLFGIIRYSSDSSVLIRTHLNSSELIRTHLNSSELL